MSKKKSKSKQAPAPREAVADGSNLDVAPKEVASAQTPAAKPWPIWLKASISVVLCLHLLIVFWAPLTFNTRGRSGESPLTNDVMWLLQPYADFFYLNQGYAFFAPDPGPSHLLEYRIDGKEGDAETVDARRFPSRGHRFPRLHYHRHFMLAEWLNMGFTDPLPLEGPIDPNHRRAHALYHDLKKSFEEHLEYELDADEVQIVRVEHRPPDPIEFVEQKIPLDDPSLFTILPEAGQQPPPSESPGPTLPRPADPPLGPVPGPPFDPMIPFGPGPLRPPVETVPTPQTETLPETIPQAAIETVPVPTPEPEAEPESEGSDS